MPLRSPFLYAAIALIMLPSLVFAQVTDSDETKEHSNKRERPLPEPARASMLSATMPGLGQIYNRKYWKVPIIYAGFGTLVYFVGINNTEYQKYRTAYIARIDENPNTTDDFPLYSTDVLQRAMNIYRRNLEVTYLIGAALYLLNILDANVDAHLMDFDVGEKLSLGIATIQSSSPGIFSKSNRPHAGISIRYSF